MSEKVASFILRQINRLNRVRDAVYLDTNAWSKLAKREISHEPLQDWVRERGYHIWMARFQMAELTGDTRLARPLAELLRVLPVVILDRAQNEFYGEPWYKVRVELDEYIQLKDDPIFNEFISQLINGPIRKAREQLKADAEGFQIWLESALAAIPADTARTWKEFPKRLEHWIRSQCERNNTPVNEQALSNPECFVGLRLSYGVLFWRYFINRQPWRPPDYVDYLHAADMAYAEVVVTEHNLAECIRQLARRPEVHVPRLVVGLSWLENPSNAVTGNKSR